MNTKAKSKTTLRYELLGTIPTEDDKYIKTSKLPNVKQVLLCFLANLEQSSSQDAAKTTAQVILTYLKRPEFQPSK